MDPLLHKHSPKYPRFCNVGARYPKGPNPLGMPPKPDQNGSMHANRILLFPLILASLALDLAVIRSLSEQTVWPNLLVAVTLGLAGGQVNVATFWAVLGCHHLPWRIATAFVVPISWSFALVVSAPKILAGYDAASMWGVHFLTQTALLASILVVTRLFGARLATTDFAASDRPTSRQFSIRYLFAWLTATAITLSLLKTIFENADVSQARLLWPGALTVAFGSVMLGLTCMWLVCDSSRRPRRYLAAFFTALPVGGLTAFLLASFGNNRLAAVLLLWFAASAYTAVALVVLRVAGFQIVWLGAKNPETPAPPRE